MLWKKTRTTFNFWRCFGMSFLWLVVMSAPYEKIRSRHLPHQKKHCININENKQKRKHHCFLGELPFWGNLELALFIAPDVKVFPKPFLSGTPTRSVLCDASSLPRQRWKNHNLFPSKKIGSSLRGMNVDIDDFWTIRLLPKIKTKVNQRVVLPVKWHLQKFRGASNPQVSACNAGC